MIAVGNPLLDGPDAHSSGRSKLAHARQRCPETLGPWKVKVVGTRPPGVAPIVTRGNLADLKHLRALAPLPETADELCDVAHDVGDCSRSVAPTFPCSPPGGRSRPIPLGAIRVSWLFGLLR